MKKNSPNNKAQAPAKYFAIGRVSYTDRSGKAITATDGEPIDPCDDDFDWLMKSNAIADKNPNAPIVVEPDDLDGEGLDELNG